ncbi:hypothetical protein D3C76_1101890 [compost metagenome]
MREVRQVLALSQRLNPREDRHVGDGVLACHEWHLGQTRVQHPIQPRRFGIEQVEGERNRLRRLLLEHLQLAQVRRDMPHLPEQPFLNFLPLDTAARRQKTPGLVRQVIENGARFEQAQRFTQTLRRMIDNRRNPPIGTDPLERRLLLLALADVDRHHPVIQPEFFEQDADFQAIAGGPVIQIDHA